MTGGEVARSFPFTPVCVCVLASFLGVCPLVVKCIAADRSIAMPSSVPEAALFSKAVRNTLDKSMRLTRFDPKDNVFNDLNKWKIELQQLQQVSDKNTVCAIPVSVRPHPYV